MLSDTTIFVCTSCQRTGVARPDDAARSGEILHVALVAANPDHRIVAVSCMNNCLNGCTVAFGAPGKWAYVFGDIEPDMPIDELLAIADFHAQSTDGQVPWGKRPEALKRKTISRIPPMFATAQTNDAA